MSTLACALLPAGVGPAPVPIHKLRAHHLEAAIVQLLRPETQEAARRAGDMLRQEAGLEAAVAHIYRGLAAAGRQ